MIEVQAGEAYRNCNGITRRSCLKAGLLGATGLGLADMLRYKAQAREAGRNTRDTAVILIWIDGGPSQLETYDPKPDAPVEFRGPFNAVRTSIPGVLFSELCAKQAALMNHLSVVRTIHHTTGDHFAAGHWMLTGYFGPINVNPEPHNPSVGAVASKLRRNRPGVPAYVGVPHMYNLDGNFTPGYHGAAALGAAFNPFQIETDPNRDDFSVRNLTLPTGISMERLADRRHLLDTFDNIRRDLDRHNTFASMDRFNQEAFEMVSGPRARQAFDVQREDARIRDRYGRNIWGQSCLLARRLVENGVTFVTIEIGNWDDHGNIEGRMKERMPSFDHAVSTLITDLIERGLYEKVAVCLVGEFGRAPRITEGGREHWARTFSGVLGGGGLRGGQVIGATSAKAEFPTQQPVSPENFLANLYHVLGIDTRIAFTDSLGRSRAILNNAVPLAQLI